MGTSASQHPPPSEAYAHCVEMSLQNDLRMAQKARVLVRGNLRSWGVAEECISIVELLTSEAVSNAVLHAAPPVHVMLRHGDPGVRVEVVDSRPELHIPSAPHPDQTGGRGLWLIQMLATRWGHRGHGQGKVVWFDVGSTPVLRPASGHPLAHGQP